MANYTLRSDGSAANKAAALNGDPAVASECMTITVAEGESYSAGDRLQMESTNGGVYRGNVFNVTSNGSAGNPIVIEAYSGHSPQIFGSENLNSAAYKWTASGSGTNEWYCEAAAGGDPGLSEPDLVVFHNATPSSVVHLVNGTVGSLADHESDYGDNDTLGYSTVYIRDDTGDPDGSGVQIEVDQIGCVYGWSVSYVTVDGLDVRYGIDPNGGIRFDESSNIIVQNCEAHWNGMQGISVKDTDCTIDNCVASYNSAHGIGSGGGSETDKASGITIKNCTASYTRTIQYIGGTIPFDGYGLKFLWADDSVMYNNESHHNNLQGIDLDGGGSGRDPGVDGCDRCELYNNYLHHNGADGIALELGSRDCNIHHNRLVDNCLGGDGQFWCFELHLSTDCDTCDVHYNVIYRTEAFNTTGTGMIKATNGGQGSKIYNNTMDAAGFCGTGIWIEGPGDAGQPCIDVKIKNNIIKDTSDSCIWLLSSDYTGFECDYNQYLRSDADTDVIYRDWNRYTIAEHFASFAEDENSQVGDPSFTSEATGDYTLSSGSSCINSAVDLGASYNEALMPGSTWPSGVVTGDQDDY